MIQISEATITRLIVHSVGNKSVNEDLHLSDNEIDPMEDELLTSLLMKFFFTPFMKGDAFFNFTHSSDLALNEVYSICTSLFNLEMDFDEASSQIAAHLYNVTDHPNIKSGDLFVAYFCDVIVDAEVVNAIGIFKSESKQAFFNVQEFEGEKTLLPIDGINPTSLDKGCLIFDTDRDQGLKVCVVDNTSRNSESVYWKEVFL